MAFERLIALGFMVVFLGVILIISGGLLSTFRGDPEASVETGGIIMIGPIPIIFGNSKPLIVISIVGAIALMALYFFISRGEILR